MTVQRKQRGQQGATAGAGLQAVPHRRLSLDRDRLRRRSRLRSLR